MPPAGKGLSPCTPGSQMLRPFVPKGRHICWRASPVCILRTWRFLSPMPSDLLTYNLTQPAPVLTSIAPSHRNMVSPGRVFLSARTAVRMGAGLLGVVASSFPYSKFGKSDFSRGIKDVKKGDTRLTCWLYMGIFLWVPCGCCGGGVPHEKPLRGGCRGSFHAASFIECMAIGHGVHGAHRRIRSGRLFIGSNSPLGRPIRAPGPQRRVLTKMIMFWFQPQRSLSPDANLPSK